MNELVEWLKAQLDEDERACTIIVRGPRKLGKALAARVLREVEATRRLIQRYLNAVAATPSAISSYTRGQDDGYREACLDALRDAAEVYADRAGYREEWRPDSSARPSTKE